MPTAQELNTSPRTEPPAQDGLGINSLDFFSVVWPKRWWLAKLAGCGAIAAIIIALVLPNQYESTATLMPPDETALSGGPLTAALEGAEVSEMSSAAALFGNQTTGDVILGVLQSRTVQEDIVNHLDLLHVYRVKYLADACKVLNSRSRISQDKRSGIISITVTDTDPNRARQIANDYVDELNMLITRLSSSSARRERIFLDDRLETVTLELNQASQALGEFSSQNRTENIQDQAKAMLAATGTLQSELIMAEGNLKSLEATYGPDNSRVQAAQARVSELRSNLEKMSGAEHEQNGSDSTSDEIYPSLRQLPLLGETYENLYRRTTMLEAIYLLLSKQDEIAKVEEAEESPSVRILDQPNVPEKKSSPHRLMIVLAAMLFSTFCGTSWLMGKAWWIWSAQQESLMATGRAGTAEVIDGQHADASPGKNHEPISTEQNKSSG